MCLLHRFGSRKLANPLGFASFGFETADEAEPAAGAAADEEMTDQFADIKVGGEAATAGAGSKVKSETAEASTGGAAGKFRKKEKKKKKKHVM